MASIFITLQGKGGVGKSYLTAAFAQWAIDRDREVICIDTDTLNPTLLAYKPLNATHLKLSENHVVDPRVLDSLVAIASDASEEAFVVIDVGSNGFETLMAYEGENQVFSLLEDEGHSVYVQTVIAGGPDAEETLKGTMALLEVTEVPIVLWLNEHLGPLEVAGKPLEQVAFLSENQERFIGKILLAARTHATFGKDVEEMLRKRLTFNEAIKRFDLMPRTRIKRVRDDVWSQLDSLELLIPAGVSE